MKRQNDKTAPPKALYNWYPGHMARALREIKQKLKMVDIVLEIRDARVPLNSGNFAINEGLGQKCKIIVLNKVNLADPHMVNVWSEWFEKQGEPYFFVDCFDKVALKKVITLARKIVENNRKECNPDYIETKTKLKLMIVGLPNTGKSTIINQLANRNATKVADKPGQTQIQQWITLENDVELMDTPGIMPPQIEREEHGLWLSAIHAIPDDIAGEDNVGVFVIKHLLEIKSQEFLDRYKIESADLSVDEVLVKIATVRGCLKQKGLPDLSRVYKLVLAEFRKGDLGKTCFGIPPKAKV
ncbi:MAG TPA: ribosome biogenesis GTPase YlqF [Bacteriovoracaceae bacterium]|nr:ribosome biogenesis GTPase YlqF [Bacteriovoracaceae bacterium]